jgi:hypothetical protein
MNRVHRKLRYLAALAGVGLLPMFAAQAHHSDAMFDRAQVRELSGVVKEFQFTNPHTWVQLNVTGEDGKTVEWSLEWGSPNQLGRQGIRPSTFPAGAEVTIRTNPMRDGTPGGAFVGARFPDGTTIGRWD